MFKSLSTVAAVACLAMSTEATTFYKETFGAGWEDRWVQSTHKQDSDEAGKLVGTAGKWFGDKDIDQGVQTSQDARFYAYSSKFDKSFSNKGKDLVLQFSVKHEQKIDCGGGYIKLHSGDLDQENYNGDSEYAIMFGPDVCGTSTKRIHAIFNYKGKNLLIKKTVPCETDQLTHVYTLVVKPDNTYEIRVDGEKKESGDLEADWEFLEPKMTKDPAQSKPSDWVDSPMMDDPKDEKPAGYDDIARQVDDPDAEKPDDWDDEDDGEWEAPMVDNPEYKGPWRAEQVENPAYKGPWEHPEIANPDYAADDDLYSYADLGAVGLELWQVKAGSIFDNVIVTDSIEEAEAFVAETSGATAEAEKAMFDKAEEEKREKEDEERKAADAARKAMEEEEDSEEESDSEEDDLDAKIKAAKDEL